MENKADLDSSTEHDSHKSSGSDRSIMKLLDQSYGKGQEGESMPLFPELVLVAQ